MLTKYCTLDQLRLLAVPAFDELTTAARRDVQQRSGLYAAGKKLLGSPLVSGASCRQAVQTVPNEGQSFGDLGTNLSQVRGQDDFGPAARREGAGHLAVPALRSLRSAQVRECRTLDQELASAARVMVVAAGRKRRNAA